MFQSEPLKTDGGPTAFLLMGPNDPLGVIAACAKMYKGEVVRDVSFVTDDERRHYLQEMQKTKLAMPLESVQFHFMLEGVTRGFTHQMVRQRTAAYAQESMRFAVVEDTFTDRVALPPSLAGTRSWAEQRAEAEEHVRKMQVHPSEDIPALIRSYIERNNSEADKQRCIWDKTVHAIQLGYQNLVDSGMPAEDARGLLPTNITTRLNYITNFRGLLDHAGNRLCTQAQFEWRLVLAKMAEAIRLYGQKQTYIVRTDTTVWAGSSAWQFDALADLLRPVCYQVGKCVMKADFDRKCSIRGRVEKFAEHNVPSEAWGGGSPRLGLLPIHPAEWLADPGAAR